MLAILLTSSLAATTPHIRDMTLRQIKAMAQVEGAKAVVDRLHRSGQWWRLTRHIADGRPDWIALAPILSIGTDAGTSESLTISLARALPKSTAATVAALDESGDPSPCSVERVCSSPFIEESGEDGRSYRLLTLSALKRVDTPRLQRIAAACADELKKVR